MLRRELDGDQDRGGEGGDLRQGAAAGDEGDEQGEADGERLEPAVWSHSSEPSWPQMLNGELRSIWLSTVRS